MLELNRKDARRLLAVHHLTPTDIAGVFARLGSVQYDPLKPVGRNCDLVLQARVPAYHVDDWEKAAYQQRLVYDAWDKQASLVRTADWPCRRIYHRWHAKYWDELNAHPEAVQMVLDELAERGPLASSDFDYQVHKKEWEGTWYGPKLTKRALRMLWHTGRVVTHHREGGKHVYDLAERVIPVELHGAAPLSDEEMLRWLVLLRHQAVGLLRPNADASLWSMGITAAERKALIAELVAEGKLVAVDVEGMRFHALPEMLERLDSDRKPAAKMTFLAPLDQLLWDRKAVRHIFGFDYVWEVYKPRTQRKWGYYVLPVFYEGRFVARFDSRLEGRTWHIYNWWWEADVAPDVRLLEAVRCAATAFLSYLGAEGVRVAESVDAKTHAAFKASEWST
jgi:uncharacterized protein YcaQ